jgi:uncharacterized membrane protein
LKDTGNWDSQGWICLDDLQKFRQRYLEELLLADKGELEIRHLHQKIDHLIYQQWERMVEIQEIQSELINEIRSRR